METKKKDVQELQTDHQKSRLPTWLGHLGRVQAARQQIPMNAIFILCRESSQKPCVLHNIKGTNYSSSTLFFLGWEGPFPQNAQQLQQQYAQFSPQHSTFKPLFYGLASKVNHMVGLLCILFAVRYSIFCQLEQMVRQKTFHRQQYFAFIYKSFWQQNTLASQSPFQLKSAAPQIFCHNTHILQSSHNSSKNN